MQSLQNLPAASKFDPRRLFPCPSARDTNGGLTNAAPPEPIDGRRAATEPTDNPRCAPPTTPPAATHRHRAPDATRLVVPPSCRTNASRMPHEPMPPEPIDGRRTATQPTGRSIRGARRHAPSPRPRRDPTSTRAALLFHPSCRTASRANATRANRRETRRDGAHRRSGTRRRPHRPPPRTITTPPTRPPRPPTLQRNPRHDEATPARFRARRRRSGRAAAPR